MTNPQRPRVEFPGDKLQQIVAETQEKIKKLSQSTDPDVQKFVQELQSLLKVYETHYRN